MNIQPKWRFLLGFLVAFALTVPAGAIAHMPIVYPMAIVAASRPNLYPVFERAPAPPPLPQVRLWFVPRMSLDSVNLSPFWISLKIAGLATVVLFGLGLGPSTACWATGAAGNRGWRLFWGLPLPPTIVGFLLLMPAKA